MSDTPPDVPARKARFNMSALTKTKVAGIPVIYILLVVAAIGLFMALRMKKSTVDEPMEETDPVTDEVALPTYDNPVFEADAPQGGTVTTGGVNGGEGDSGVPEAEPDPGPEVVDPGIDEGVSQPVGDVTPPVAPPPPPPPPPPAYKPRKQGTPGCAHTVEGGQDNGPGDLALLYYGVNNADAVNKIAAQNIEKPMVNGKWPVGTHLWIPPNVAPKYFTATNSVRSAPDIAAKNGVPGGGPEVKALNPSKSFPVNVGVKVRVD